MNPITHVLLSWGVANTLPDSTRRDRTLITLAGVAPDLDGLGLVAEVLTAGTPDPLRWWTDYHHVLGHNIIAAAAVTGLAVLMGTSRIPTAFLASLSFHLHLLCDVAGSRGPDGHPWPIPYLLPFSSSVQWTWDGQWALNAWQNFVVTVAALAATFVLAHRRGVSPLELVSERANGIFVETLRKRFPPSRHEA